MYVIRQVDQQRDTYAPETERCLLSDADNASQQISVRSLANQNAHLCSPGRYAGTQNKAERARTHKTKSEAARNGSKGRQDNIYLNGNILPRIPRARPLFLAASRLSAHSLDSAMTTTSPSFRVSYRVFESRRRTGRAALGTALSPRQARVVIEREPLLTSPSEHAFSGIGGH